MVDDNQNFNKYILETFKYVFSSSPFVEVLSNTISIKTETVNLVDINLDQIILGNKINLTNKIQAKTRKTDIIDSTKVIDFLNALKDKSLNLNHVGVSYHCVNFQDETKKYIQDLDTVGLKVYEEQAENKNEKWLFVGNTSQWKAPLCEIVLNSSIAEWNKDWIPAFQVDVDTTCTMDELETLSQKFFGNNFWKWKLDILDYGVVLAMAILGEINGTKITFGVGTNLRNTQHHRESMKHLVNKR